MNHAIPVKPTDRTLDRETYQARMQDRLQWMLDREEPGAYHAVVSAMAEEGLDLGAQGPESPVAAILAQHRDLRLPGLVESRALVRTDNSLVEPMQETSLAEWISHLAPPRGNSHE